MARVIRSSPLSPWRGGGAARWLCSWAGPCITPLPFSLGRRFREESRGLRQSVLRSDKILPALPIEGLEDQPRPGVALHAVAPGVSGDPQIVEKAFEPVGGSGDVWPEDTSKPRAREPSHVRHASQHHRQGEGTCDTMRDAIVKRERIGDRMCDGG